MKSSPSAAAAAAVPDPAAELAALRARVQDLERAVEARDDFLAVAAHELRSPLNALSLRLGLLERLAAREGASPTLGHEITRTRRVIDRYVGRAAVLLDVARVNAGALVTHRESVDIRRLVDQVIDAWRDEAAVRGATLEAFVESDGTGQWDPHMVDQVLANLVSNAVKYGEGRPVQLRAGVAGDVAWFEVVDGGPGIGDADRARIFDKFERLAFNRGTRGGYGLGLWIVGSMLSAHGGSIQVEAAQPRGSIFRVKLPLKV